MIPHHRSLNEAFKVLSLSQGFSSFSCLCLQRANSKSTKSIFCIFAFLSFCVVFNFAFDISEFPSFVTQLYVRRIAISLIWFSVFVSKCRNFHQNRNANEFLFQHTQSMVYVCAQYASNPTGLRKRPKSREKKNQTKFLV